MLNANPDGSNTLCASLLEKIREQFERTSHLIGLVPAAQLDWAPPMVEGRPGAWTMGELLGHLLECMAGFCAVLAAAEPQRLEHFATLREVLVNHRCPPDEAAARIEVYRAHTEEGFALLTDTDLARRVPTVFVERGEPLLTLLLGNLEHLTNHKHQLFTYLKLMGVQVATRDLYQFRA
jgi:uncharacterized damage-inducible protein DinB